MIAIRTEREIALLREANRIVAETLCALADRVEPGITTAELDAVAEKLIRAAGGEPSFLGYQGYPASTCISVDEEIIHGIPGTRRLREGEICSLDVGVRYKGYYGDAAVSVPVGDVDDERRRLLDATDRSLANAIAAAIPGNTIDDIGRAVEGTVRPEGFSVVRNFVGHGIGTEMHAEPQVPNFSTGRRGPKLKPGMVLAIEPMINAGTEDVEMLDDGWTAVTADGRPSAHFEHSIVIRDGEAEILSVSAAAHRRWGLQRVMR
jgi:methionyl aminopeptidase